MNVKYLFLGGTHDPTVDGDSASDLPVGGVLKKDGSHPKITA